MPSCALAQLGCSAPVQVVDNIQQDDRDLCTIADVPEFRKVSQEHRSFLYQSCRSAMFVSMKALWLMATGRATVEGRVPHCLWCIAMMTNRTEIHDGKGS